MNKKIFVILMTPVIITNHANAIEPSNILCDVCAVYAECLQEECAPYAEEQQIPDNTTVGTISAYCRQHVHDELDNQVPFNSTMIDNYLLSNELADQLVYDILGAQFVYKCKYDASSNSYYCGYGDIYEACTNQHTNVCTCPNGYYLNYGSYSNGRTTQCVPCPDSGTSDGGSLQKNCYLPANSTFRDTTGNGEYTNSCYYTN